VAVETEKGDRLGVSEVLAEEEPAPSEDRAADEDIPF
jgi:hypothetical protein